MVTWFTLRIENSRANLAKKWKTRFQPTNEVNSTRWLVKIYNNSLFPILFQWGLMYYSITKRLRTFFEFKLGSMKILPCLLSPIKQFFHQWHNNQSSLTSINYVVKYLPDIFNKTGEFYYNTLLLNFLQ